MTDTDKSAEVTQADRDAAAISQEGWPNTQKAIREGKHDHGTLVQTFARHRTEAIADLLEALEPFANLMLPKRRQGNAAYYSLLHADIERAQAAIARARGTS